MTEAKERMKAEVGFPTLDGLQSLLAQHRGAAAYIVPLVDDSGRALGNNGDHLMYRVFRRALAELDIREAATKDAADIVIVPPNGALLERYVFPRLLAERLRGLENKPLVIFPSSAFFPTSNPSFIFHERKAATLWVLREKRSLDHLEANWGLELAAAGVDLRLDHDIVAAGHAFVPDIIGGGRAKGRALVAARRDVEAVAAHLQPANGLTPTSRGLAHKMAPILSGSTFGTAIGRAARRGVNALSAEAMLRSVPEDVLDWAGLDRVLSRRRTVSDVSAPQFATFDEYCRAIRESEVVITNRLHVGLPAAALGRRVVLVEAGYYKLRGIYERSLADVENVRLVVPESGDPRQT